MSLAKLNPASSPEEKKRIPPPEEEELPPHLGSEVHRIVGDYLDLGSLDEFSQMTREYQQDLKWDLPRRKASEILGVEIPRSAFERKGLSPEEAYRGAGILWGPLSLLPEAVGDYRRLPDREGLNRIYSILKEWMIRPIDILFELKVVNPLIGLIGADNSDNAFGFILTAIINLSIRDGLNFLQQVLDVAGSLRTMSSSQYLRDHPEHGDLVDHLFWFIGSSTFIGYLLREMEGVPDLLPLVNGTVEKFGMIRDPTSQMWA